MKNLDEQMWEEVAQLGQAIERAKANFRGYYIINPEVCKKVVIVVRSLKMITDDLGGFFSVIDCEPSELHAGICVRIPILDLYGATMTAFQTIIANADVFGGSSECPDELLVEVQVNNLWIAVPIDK